MNVALVTGAAGFIGSHLCERLLRSGYKVIGVDNLSNGQLENLKGITNPHFLFRTVDCLHLDRLRSVFEECRPTLVFHQAALSSLQWSIDNPALIINNNVKSFENVLQLCTEFNVRRTIYASSCAVYGKNARENNCETDKLECLNPYALSKSLNEMQAELWQKHYGLSCVGLRYFNVFGPRQRTDGLYAAVIPKWIDALKNRKPLIIYGDGEQCRDFVYVDNVIEANLLAISAPLSGGDISPVYNVGSGKALKLKDVLGEICFRALKENKNHFDVQYENARPNDVKASSANLSAATRFLGYQPKYSFEEGMERTWNFFNPADSIKIDDMSAAETYMDSV